MSSDADASAAAAIVTLFNALYANTYCNVAASVLFFYDAFITFDREVACFWTAKWTGASPLFFANKWILILGYTMVLVGFASFPSDHSCSIFQRATFIFEVLQLAPGGVFSALRAYILSKNKLLGLLVLILSLVPVGANLVRYGYDFAGENLPPFGCLRTDSTTVAINLRVLLISRIPLIIADILLIGITWTKLSSREALQGLRQSKRLSLSDVLFRDGTVYFVVLFVMNVLHLVLSATALAATDDGGSYVTIFTGPITAILISRFLLQLQEANRIVVRVNPDDPLHSLRDPYDSTPDFIASLGAFINPDLPPSWDEPSEWHVDSPSNQEEDSEGGVQTSESSAGPSRSASAASESSSTV
ncbi:hypothetical protein L227DRAFT_654438 [Lentinus tigrinus ALCF2SS1-6]|uniref:DUF6533 domain-containing protein n=1 Tax=Lentinus tigrinus ALCF2SS1-6 TaxID=1328759 RepID=A0A5C2S5K8_9APHY|nr:hypothetical protein L227DRAFT_654438 [Lentinus tigrinus ALCF2SS1-6]